MQNKFMTVSEIRDSFLKFYESKSHKIVDSSSLVPNNDPTLLFTNAGMNQFKDVFLGNETRSYKRATTVQRCVRAGGKHNDLENVGYTARHHTFFEMLGNFSLADYFKKDAINFAWEFLTSKECLGLGKEKLTVTVYESDDEAYDIWNKEIGIDSSKIVRIGDNKGAPFASDNFWQMGDTGPCGPCTEIFYDHGEDIAGGPPGSPDEDGDRFIEIWNIVFMQYMRLSDGSMTPLPSPCVDTGMGLERIAAVMQNVHSNYEIDLFSSLIKQIADILNFKDLNDRSLRVIADHIRSCAYLIADGVKPSNEGRGYVLRRIIRRAIRHGNKLGAQDIFFYKIVKPLISVMGSAGTILVKNEALIEATLKKEEEQFLITLDKGMSLLNLAIANLKDGDTLSGKEAFKLYDTYGFPLDLVIDICKEKSLKVDEIEFEAEMSIQKSRAKKANKFSMDNSSISIDAQKTNFKGYEKKELTSQIIALYKDNQEVNLLLQDEEGILISKDTPFYAESGGQVGEKGFIKTQDGVFIVTDTQKKFGVFLHIGFVEEGSVKIESEAQFKVDYEFRLDSSKNHSSTHFLHLALRTVLGSHVEQKGSVVKPEFLRFDFSHDKALTKEELRNVETLVNNYIRANNIVTTQIMPIEEAKKLGAMALFSEKYGDTVRVVTMGNSIELCGGVHVERTGDIGLFKILSESAIASGVRRVEAVTGSRALDYLKDQDDLLGLVLKEFNSTKSELVQKIDNFKKEFKSLELLVKDFKNAALLTIKQDLVKEISGSSKKVLIKVLSDKDSNELRTISQSIVNEVDALVILFSKNSDKISICVALSKSLLSEFNANLIMKDINLVLKGKGGGKPDFAMGASSEILKLDEAIDFIRSKF
ncbi:MAG: alanine--tRNA ligase [Psittacicella sp.]